MKVLFYILLISFFFILVPQVSAQAVVTKVRGNVYDYNNGGAGIGGLTVTVICNGNTQTSVTDGSGLYGVNYSTSECDKFNAVTSSVTFNGQPQSQTVFVSNSNTATLDYYYGTTAVPEFGAIGGVVAALGSGLAYLGLKKKSLFSGN